MNPTPTQSKNRTLWQTSFPPCLPPSTSPWGDHYLGLCISIPTLFFKNGFSSFLFMSEHQIAMFWLPLSFLRPQTVWDLLFLPNHIRLCLILPAVNMPVCLSILWLKDIWLFRSLATVNSGAMSLLEIHPFCWMYTQEQNSRSGL